MQTIAFELDGVCPPTTQEMASVSGERYKQWWMELRDKIVDVAGEGPWPKALPRKDVARQLRRRIERELAAKAKPSRKVRLSLWIRRPDARGNGSTHGSVMMLKDALCKSGWVHDDRNWVDGKYEVIHGDSAKVVVEMQLAENAAEDVTLTAKV